MVEFRDEHGGHPVYGGTFFLLNGGQDQEGIEPFQHSRRGPVGNNRHHAQNQAETVEQGYRKAYDVLFGKPLVIAYAQAVVEDVPVGEHDPFGETRSSGGVLHVHHVVSLQGGFNGMKFLVLSMLTQEEKFRHVVHAPVFRRSYVDQAFEIREFGGIEMPPGGCFEFRNQFVDHSHIV
ncbi:hypothetical protein Holit_00813 [Hollandina sp. SP2]